MKTVDAIMKSEATFMKHIVHEDLPKDHPDWIETVYRKVREGEKVRCVIYPEPSSFLEMFYYDIVTSDGFHCKLNMKSVELVK